jgi:tRNA(Arg) A34 adenosine deaminase TadA
VIVKNEIVAGAHNEVLSSKDPTAHAAILAVRRASAALGTFDLSDCDLFTNGATCCLCISGMLWARIRKVYYNLPLEESAAIGLGDDHLHGELARPLEERQIVPMIHAPSLSAEARAAYHLWRDKPRRLLRLH